MLLCTNESKDVRLLSDRPRDFWDGGMCGRSTHVSSSSVGQRSSNIWKQKNWIGENRNIWLC